MARLNVTPLNYKSYRGKILSNHAPDGEPRSVTVKVFAGAKPKVTVTVGTGWFNESRGYGV